LAIGSERYVPYAKERRPQELLTLANAILGQGQLSLAKYLLLVAKEDDAELDIHDISAFLKHLLSRVDWKRDLHFHTRTTIDTLDYSAGEGLNAGSKLVIAACGSVRRSLATTTESLDAIRLPAGIGPIRVVHPGILAIRAPAHGGIASGEYHHDLQATCDALRDSGHDLEGFPLVTLVDDADFCAHDLSNWLWAVFTRSNPATDVWGAGATIYRKHFGCTGPLVIDARWKPHMAPPLEEDPAVTKRVDALAARGGPLFGLID
jgi:4-hydroxy-3-polyprenylbenzoate decarboxylase